MTWWWEQGVRCYSQAGWSFLSSFAMPKRWRRQYPTETTCIVVSSSLCSIALVLCSKWLGTCLKRMSKLHWERIRITQSKIQEVGRGNLLPSLRPEFDPWTHMVVGANQFVEVVFWPEGAHKHPVNKQMYGGTGSKLFTPPFLAGNWLPHTWADFSLWSYPWPFLFTPAFNSIYFHSSTSPHASLFQQPLPAHSN